MDLRPVMITLGLPKRLTRTANNSNTVHSTVQPNLCLGKRPTTHDSTSSKYQLNVIPRFNEFDVKEEKMDLPCKASNLGGYSLIPDPPSPPSCSQGTLPPHLLSGKIVPQPSKSFNSTDTVVENNPINGLPYLRTPSPEQYKTLATTYIATRKKLSFQSPIKPLDVSLKDHNSGNLNCQPDESPSDRYPQHVSPIKKSNSFQSHCTQGSSLPSPQTSFSSSTMSVTLLKCPKCKFESNSHSSTRRHLKRMHKVSIDDVICEYLNINKDVKTQTCKDCNMPFMHRFKHSKICKKKQPNETVVLKCPKCKFESTSRISLRRHLIRIHKVKLEDVILEYLDINKNSESYFCDACNIPLVCWVTHSRICKKKKHNQVLIHKCPKCEFETHFSHSLSRHMRQVHKLTIDDVILEYLDINKNLSERICIDCNMPYRFMKHHLKICKSKKSQEVISKENENPIITKIYHCVDCEFKASYKRTLIKHVTKPHKVNWCDVAKDYDIN